MKTQIPLIQKKIRGQEQDYSICSEGVFILKKLKSKKLRIIFNITNEKKTISSFNHWIINKQADEQQCEPTACLTISSQTKQLSEDRVIVVMTAYQCYQKQPLMVLLGYLGASVFIYHHYGTKPSSQSPLTLLLAKLWNLLSQTDIHQLNSQLSYSKGYASTPYFLCLLSQKQEQLLFEDVYKCEEQNQTLNKSIDTLIDYFPQRRALSSPRNKQDIGAIGTGFQQQIVGRTVFNFEFTGGTLQNLCFDCCQSFNMKKIINLNQCYLKIVKNQKARLEGETIENFMLDLSSIFFFGSKVQMGGQSQLPLSSYQLLTRYRRISENVLATSLRSATSCMTLNQFRSLQQSLRKYFNQKLSELQQSNSLKANQLCNQCYSILDNLSEVEYNSENLYTLISQIQNNLSLFSSESQILTKGDHVQRLLWQYYTRLCDNYFSHLENFTRQVVDQLQLQDQRKSTQIEDLKYELRLKQNELRNLQYQYELQGDILNQTKSKLFYENTSTQDIHQNFSLQNNKLRRRLQELQQQVQDKSLNIEELESLLEKFEGVVIKDKGKCKFSKQIQDLMKDITQKINTYYNVVRQVKKINQLEDDLRQRLNKQKNNIIEDQKQSKRELAKRQSELDRIKNQKITLEQTIQETHQTIRTMKEAALFSKETSTSLQKRYAELHCRLAQTQHQFEYYRKALLLAGEQVSKGGKSEKLIKFSNTASITELKDLLRPFIKK